MTTASRDATLWNWSLGALVVSVATSILAGTTADPDLWGHLRFGLDMLESGGIATRDPYSYLTASQPWVNHEWLVDPLFALAWRAGGASGLIALKLGIGLLTLGLLWSHLRALGLPGVRAVSVLLLLGSALCVAFFAVARAHMFSLLLFTLTLLAIRRAEARDYRWLWAAPPITAAWSNLHGGVLAGLGVLGLWALLHLPRHWPARRHILAPAAATAGALLLNPYGAELPVFLLRTATVPRPEITDWQPLALFSAPGVMYLAMTATMVAGLLGSRRPRGVLTPALCTIAMLLPLLAVRHLPLAGIIAIVFASEHVADVWERTVGRFGTTVSDAPGPVFSLVAAFAAVALLAATAAQGRFTSIQVPVERLPVAAVALLQRSGVAGNLVIEFTWGEYAIWHLGPGIKVSMDGRRETVYPPRIYSQYLDFALGRGDWSAFLREGPPDMALLGNGKPACNLLRLSPDWQLVFEDPASALFVRRDSSLAQRVRETARDFVPPAPTREFP